MFTLAWAALVNLSLHIRKWVPTLLNVQVSAHCWGQVQAHIWTQNALQLCTFHKNSTGPELSTQTFMKNSHTSHALTFISEKSHIVMRKELLDPSAYLLYLFTGLQRPWHKQTNWALPPPMATDSLISKHQHGSPGCGQHRAGPSPSAHWGGQWPHWVPCAEPPTGPRCAL